MRIDLRDGRPKGWEDFGMLTVGVLTPMANEDFCPLIGSTMSDCLSFTSVSFGDTGFVSGGCDGDIAGSFGGAGALG